MHLRITEILNNMADTEEAAGLRRSLQQSLDSIFEILYRADVRKQIEIEKNWDKAKGVQIIENVSINELHKNELKNIIEAKTFADAEKWFISFLENKKTINTPIFSVILNHSMSVCSFIKNQILMYWPMAS